MLKTASAIRTAPTCVVQVNTYSGVCRAAVLSTPQNYVSPIETINLNRNVPCVFSVPFGCFPGHSFSCTAIPCRGILQLVSGREHVAMNAFEVSSDGVLELDTVMVSARLAGRLMILMNINGYS